ncbi:MAG: hypothetical protein CVU08_15875, partial [Bacteroidetes bacterium HGW-Bacteroidetes-3]
NNCDLTNNYGGEDGWVFKLSQDFSSIDNYISFNNIKIFSNPVHNELIFQVNSKMIGETYQIYSITGKCELSGIVNSETMELNLGSFSVGIYLLQIGNQTKKIVKVK